MSNNGRKEFVSGIIDSVPIALGYFAVAFTLGIVAKNAGLTAVQTFLATALTNASAGGYRTGPAGAGAAPGGKAAGRGFRRRIQRV